MNVVLNKMKDPFANLNELLKPRMTALNHLYNDGTDKVYL